jgi:hypothetical protein
MSRDYVMQVHSGPTAVYDPPQYLKAYDLDVNAPNYPTGVAELTPHKHEALSFMTAGDVLATWRAASTAVPTRPDGRPNRPLTVYSITPEPRESAQPPTAAPATPTAAVPGLPSEGLSETPTPYAVRCHCVNGDLVYMTFGAYMRQMARPNSFWICPRCGCDARWDDANYESRSNTEDAE